jgi:outer membrane protein TolC
MNIDSVFNGKLMKLYKIIFHSIFFVFWFFCYASPVFAQTLTMDGAIATALKNNQKIKQYEEKLQQKKYDNIEAWGNFLPKVDLSGSYTRMNEPLTMDLSPIRNLIINLQANDQTELTNISNILQSGVPLNQQQKGVVFQQAYSQLNTSIPSFTEVFKQQDFKTATLTAVQPVFLGGKLIAAKKFASDELHSAEIELQKTKDDVIKETADNYLTVVLLQDIIKTRKAVLDGMKKHEALADKMFQEGIIANYNLLRAKVAVADAERDLFDAENNLDLAILSLKNSLGISEAANIQIADSLVYSDVLNDFNSYLETAMENQPVLKIISLKKDAAQQNFNVERSKFLPQAGLFGQYQMYPQYLSIIEPRWVIGFQVSINLFNGFQDYAKLQSARHLEDEVNYIQSDAERSIRLLINKNYKDAADSRERYIKTKASIELSKENLRLNEKRFETGLGTSLEVVDAELSLARNEIESEISLYDYYKNLTALNINAGNSNEVLRMWNKAEGR